MQPCRRLRLSIMVPFTSLTLFTIGASTMWAMMIVAIDASIIYGLTAHGEVFE